MTLGCGSYKLQICGAIDPVQVTRWGNYHRDCIIVLRKERVRQQAII